MSEQRAKKNAALVREVGRSKVREFVERWLSGNFGDAEEYRVVVRFADEAPLAAADRSSR